MPGLIKCAAVVGTLFVEPRLAHLDRLSAGPKGYPKMLYAGQNSTQIAAPQRATNQASESQTSTSSRVMVGFYQMMLFEPREARW
jgi:hypothetical protein